MNRKITGLLILAALTSLLAVLAVREHFEIQIDPLSIIAAFLVGIFILAVLVRHPAAFVAPALFIPWFEKRLILPGAGVGSRLTWLILAATALGTALVARLAQWSLRPDFIENPFKDHRREIGAFFLFATLLTISYSYTPASSYGGDKLQVFLMLGIPLFLSPFVLIRSKKDFRDFVIGVAAFGLIVAASSLTFSSGGAMGTAENPTHIGKGQVIGMAMLLLLYQPITNRRLRLIVLLICIPWLAIGLVSAETRGPLFSLLLVLALSYVIPAMRSPLISRWQMTIVALALIGAVLILAAYWFYGASASRFNYKTTELIQLFEGSPEARGTGVERLVFYEDALDAWQQHPAFGLGIGGWSTYYFHQDNYLYPHNMFLEVLMEEGLIGVAALIYFLGVVFQKLKRNLAEVHKRYTFLLPVWIYLLSITMFSGDLDDDRFVWFWCGLVLQGCHLAYRLEVEDRTLEGEEENHGIPQPSPV